MNNGEKPRLLVVEDDRSLREGLVLNFRLKGYEVLAASNGDDGMRLAFDARPDVIVLDIMMPGYSGLEILEELRQRGEAVPVLVLSARGSLNQRVEGLNSGADDYLPKPFELSELLARVEALLRRARAHRVNEPDIRFGDTLVSPQDRRVTRFEASVELSAKEFDILLVLARSPGRIFTRDELLEKVWGWDFEGTARTVDNYILSLRKKLEEDPANPRHIRTVRQSGYKLEL